MNKIQIKELQGAIAQINTNDQAKSTFTIEDNFAYFTPEGHRAYKISVNVLSETVEEIPKNNYSRTIPNTFNAIATYGINQININQSDLLQLARQHKKKNSKTPFIFEYHGKNYGFQSRYIIDALKTLGTKSKISISNEKYAKLYIESEIGTIIILPVRLNEYRRYEANYTE